MYKIFVNDVPFSIAATKDAGHFQGYRQFIDEGPEALQQALEMAWQGNPELPLLFLTPNPEECLKQVLALHQVIHAAGGVVFNSKKELLVIFRLGHWDLPKGKADAGETWEEAALREVEEECGLKELQLLGEAGTTYHTYMLKGERVLKISHWYQMFYPGNEPPHPQVEEHITAAKWVAWPIQNLDQVNFYSSIMDLLRYIKIR